MAIITISRQFGAGGRTLGKLVAEKLGYAFVDEEIIQMLAKQAKASAGGVESVEKEAGGRLLKYITKLVPKSFVDLILNDQRGYDEEIYVDLLYQIINRIADEGNTVIIGRGSQYILRNRKDAYHILLVAQKEDRIRFMEKNYNLSPKEAALVVNKQDQRRMNLYKKLGKEDYDQPYLYHLVINSSKQELRKAADIICQLVAPDR
ncbi:MAG: cytidylate kinase-like family protein [Deltaproteobacteria bacterium]|nr:cytidylate kinase-like family protein [Deltaproteobacteria bacterium]MBW1962038.1 cytidylate kinase-like family protein [Deltaproteobacteria bacterium]MBW1994156.1 cytidylate kinase-like family protein [Deltaproteobacteria bacterium]MBW2153561.1 cytidylate kinase-like family protein [Deltaproteobacteria bacterium]